MAVQELNARRGQLATSAYEAAAAAINARETVGGTWDIHAPDEGSRGYSARQGTFGHHRFVCGDDGKSLEGDAEWDVEGVVRGDGEWDGDGAVGGDEWDGDGRPGGGVEWDRSGAPDVTGGGDNRRRGTAVTSKWDSYLSEDEDTALIEALDAGTEDVSNSPGAVALGGRVVLDADEFRRYSATTASTRAAQRPRQRQRQKPLLPQRSPRTQHALRTEAWPPQVQSSQQMQRISGSMNLAGSTPTTTDGQPRKRQQDTYPPGCVPQRGRMGGLSQKTTTAATVPVLNATDTARSTMRRADAGAISGESATAALSPSALRAMDATAQVRQRHSSRSSDDCRDEGGNGIVAPPPSSKTNVLASGRETALGPAVDASIAAKWDLFMPSGGSDSASSDGEVAGDA